MVIEVTDPKDPRIAGYVGLKDGARIRDRGQFIAESRPVVLRLLETRADLVESLLMSPHQWANVEEAYGEVPAPVYVADRAVLDAVAGFPLHRGCLALARCPALDPSDLWAAGPSWWLAMEGISDHDNVGSLLRTAQVLGARGVLQTPSCADPLYRKAVRVSMGAAFCLPSSAGTVARPVVAMSRARHPNRRPDPRGVSERFTGATCRSKGTVGRFGSAPKDPAYQHR